MNREELKVLLRQTGAGMTDSSGCPGEEVLASYIEGGLSQPDHVDFERHLVDCCRCMDVIGMLGRSRSSDAVANVPDPVLARARRLQRKETVSRSSPRSLAPAWAAAAAIVLALALLLHVRTPAEPETEGGAVRTERNMQPLASEPRVLSPAEGAWINGTKARFEWSPVAYSLYYRIRIVSDSGDLLWQEHVRDTHWILPAQLRLHPGENYFVRIDAHVSEAKALSSDYVGFYVRERR